MWCGQSFKSLADMTQHMKVTQHYTNIISQEQITSWRTPDEKMAQSQVNAVLTCKVCDEAFGSLKELSNHMIKNSHFKESNNSGRSTPTSSTGTMPQSGNNRAPPSSSSTSSKPSSGGGGGGGTSSERRKKSLPVRKLLELERGEYQKKPSGDEDDVDGESSEKSSLKSSQLIECDDCHDKIEPRCFLQHIKQCRLRNAKTTSDAESDKSKSETDNNNKQSGTMDDNVSVRSTPDLDQNTHSSTLDKSSDSKNEYAKESDSNENNESNKVGDSAGSGGGGDGSAGSGSVLSALEKLIEKNFDSKSRRSQQTGILQRLGIDEEVFPPWQNMAPSPLSAMSPSMAAAWANGPIGSNGIDVFSRSNSSSSSNHSRMNLAMQSSGLPQLRYRRNSSSSLKEKFMSGLNQTMKTTESNGSFSSQETEEEESCDESVNSDCGRSQMVPPYSRNKPDSKGRNLNFPISSMLSSPIPARPTSASSTASSISPSDRATPSSQQANQHNSANSRMTPNSHRSGQDDDDEENFFNGPLPLCKTENDSSTTKKSRKTNGINNNNNLDESNINNGESGASRPGHNPLLQLQKLLDKTETPSRNKSRQSPYIGWPDSSSMKANSPSSSPRTPPTVHSPSSLSIKSEEISSPYLAIKCAFCDTQIASRAAYRSHLAKVHLSMRDSVDLAGVSDEELLLLVLAKNSNLPLIPGNSGLLAAAAAAAAASQHNSGSNVQSQNNSGKGRKESKRKSKSDHWESSKNQHQQSSSSPTSGGNSQSTNQESSQSKFLKYAELAKQLSSKYV